MATSWNYVSGSVIPILSTGSISSVTIETTAEDVRPSSACYVAIWGNNTTGNGSRARPYRTIAFASTVINTSGVDGVIVIGDGVYREAASSSTLQRTFIANNKWCVEINLTTLSGFAVNVADKSYFVDLRIINATSNFSVTTNHFGAKGCWFDNIGTLRGTNTSGWDNVTECIFSNCKNIALAIASSLSNNITRHNRNTFYNIANLRFLQQGTVSTNYVEVHDIIKNCNVWVSTNTACVLEWSIIDPSCNWRFNASQGTVPTTTPPTVPSGYTNYTTISALKAAYLAAFPTVVTNFNNCAVIDPLFNDTDNGDFTLQMASPAKNFSYFGGYIGALPVGVKWNLATDIIESTNITNTSGILTLTDPALVGSFTLKPKDLGLEYEIAIFPILGQVADRNGDAIDYLRNVSASTIAAGSGVLTAGTPYIVEGGSITNNSVLLAVGDKFTAVAADLGFTTSAGGVVREILEYPNKRTSEWRIKSSLTGSPISAGTGVLTIGNYYQATGSVTHNSVAYTTGDIFWAVNADLSGAGTVKEVFAAGDAYYPYVLHTKPQVNRVGNVATGAISKGNGDPTFDNTTANKFSIYARYLQPKVTIQTENLV
jgi:hypothetical protein